jgi:hypothetical protein
MKKLDFYENLFRNAFKEYLRENALITDYPTSFGCNKEEAHYGIFDLPADYVHGLGLLQDGPEYRAKPVLTAYIGSDGYAYVEETEYTDIYMRRGGEIRTVTKDSERIAV